MSSADTQGIKGNKKVGNLISEGTISLGMGITGDHVWNLSLGNGPDDFMKIFERQVFRGHGHPAQFQDSRISHVKGELMDQVVKADLLPDNLMVPDLGTRAPKPGPGFDIISGPVPGLDLSPLFKFHIGLEHRGHAVAGFLAQGPQ